MGLVTFEEAREIVRREIEPLWGPLNGTFYIAEWGAENDQYFEVNVGARELLVDNDEDYMQYDGAIHLVEKATGKYIEASFIELFDRQPGFLDSFTPIGAQPQPNHSGHGSDEDQNKHNRGDDFVDSKSSPRVDDTGLKATADLILSYSSKFLEALPNGHGVSSPLGAWLLLALLAPYSEGSNREKLELVLGVEAEEASLAASNFISNLSSELKSAVGIWYRDTLLDATKLNPFLKTLNPIVARHDTISQEILDKWAHDNTLGIIKDFPLGVGEDTAIVIASALAAKIKWSKPFEGTKTFKKGSFSGKEGMEAGEGHHIAIYKTTYGLVGVHMADSEIGELKVYSIIAESPNWTQKTTEKAAMEVVSGEAKKVSLFDLPLGESPQWYISEQHMEEAVSEIISAIVAPWEAQSLHNLLGSPGIDSIKEILGNLLPSSQSFQEFQAAQTAKAKYNIIGFEAAAVAAAGFEFTGVPQRLPKAMGRAATISFDNPYTVIAAVADSSHKNTPVFVVRVEEIVEIEKLSREPLEDLSLPGWDIEIDTADPYESIDTAFREDPKG